MTKEQGILKKLIVGLGNPGDRYIWTRHNLGFLVLEALGEKRNLSWRNSASNHGMTAKVVLEDIECSLLMPMTYMNNSGLAVARVAKDKGLNPEDILVVCDDLDLPYGKIRLRPSGSAGGHNGLKSISEHLGSDQFSRLRMGISSPQSSNDAVDYVLSNFTPTEKKSLPEFINHALDCVACWATEGAEIAMNKFNKKYEEKIK